MWNINMAEEIYNSSTDNLEPIPEAPRLNPSTGISNFTQERRLTPRIIAMRNIQSQQQSNKQSELQKFKEQSAYDRGLSEQKKKKPPTEIEQYLAGSQERGKQRAILYKVGQKLQATRARPLKGIFKSMVSYSRSTRPKADRLKVLRLQNMLDKKRLLNQIEKLKLSKRIDILRKKGMLNQVITRPIMRPRLAYPAYSTPTIQGDIDSAFFGDFTHANNDLFGNESYHDENYYNEDYWDPEWNLDPWQHLNISPKSGVSPLLW